MEMGSYDILGRSGGERITQLGYVHNYGKDPKLIGFTEDGKFFVWNLS